MELHRLDKQPVVTAREPRQKPRRNGQYPSPVLSGPHARPEAEAAAGAAPSLPCRTPPAPATPASDAHCKAHAPHPPSANSIASGRAPPRRSPPQAPPRAARSPDTPPARACPGPDPGMCRSHGSHRVRPPTRRPVSSRCFTRALTCRQLLYVRGRIPQTPRSPPAHRRQCRRRHPRAEQHRHHLRQPPLRQELRMTQPDRRIGKPRTILRRGRHAGRERRPRRLTATPAATRMTPMLRDLQRARLRQVEYLTRYRMTDRRRRRQRRPAAPAGRRNMLLKPVRAGRTAQRLALVPRLSARLTARLAPQATGSALRRWLLQTVARRRLAAVAAVQTKTTLQRRYPLNKTRVLLPKPSGLPLQTRDLLTRMSRTRAPSNGSNGSEWLWRGLAHFKPPRQPPPTPDILGSYEMSCDVMFRRAPLRQPR